MRDRIGSILIRGDGLVEQIHEAARLGSSVRRGTRLTTRIAEGDFLLHVLECLREVADLVAARCGRHFTVVSGARFGARPVPGRAPGA